MKRRQSAAQTLVAKIEGLPPNRLAEVADFVEFVRQREEDRSLARAASKVSERSFARVWDNAADSVYDEL